MDQTYKSKQTEHSLKGSWNPNGGVNITSLSTTWLPGGSTIETSTQPPLMDTSAHKRNKLEERMNRQHLHQLSFDLSSNHQRGIPGLGKSDLVIENGQGGNSKILKLKHRFESSRVGEALNHQADGKIKNWTSSIPNSRLDSSPKAHLGLHGQNSVGPQGIFNPSEYRQGSFDGRMSGSPQMTPNQPKQIVGIGSNNIKVLEELQRQRAIPLQKLGKDQTQSRGGRNARHQQLIYFKELSPRSGAKKGKISFSTATGRQVLRTLTKTTGLGAEVHKDAGLRTMQEQPNGDITENRSFTYDPKKLGKFGRTTSHELNAGGESGSKPHQEDTFNLNFSGQQSSYMPSNWTPEKHYTQRIPQGLFRMKESSEPEKLLRSSDPLMTPSAGTSILRSGNSGFKTHKSGQDGVLRYSLATNFRANYTVPEHSGVQPLEYKPQTDGAWNFAREMQQAGGEVAEPVSATMSRPKGFGMTKAELHPAVQETEGLSKSSTPHKRVEDGGTSKLQQQLRSVSLNATKIFGSGGHRHGTWVEYNQSQHLDLGKIPTPHLIASPHPPDTLQGYIEQQIRHGLMRKQSKQQTNQMNSQNMHSPGVVVKDGKVYVNLGVLVQKVAGAKEGKRHREARLMNGDYVQGNTHSEWDGQQKQSDEAKGSEHHKNSSFRSPGLIMFQPQPGKNNVLAGEEIMIIRDMMLAKLARQRGAARKVRVVEGMCEPEPLQNSSLPLGKSGRKEISEPVVVLGQNGEHVPKFLKIKKAELHYQLNPNSPNPTRQIQSTNLRAEAIKQEWADSRLQQPVDIVPRKVPVPKRSDCPPLPDVQQSNPVLGSHSNHHKNPTANFALPVSGCANDDKEQRIKIFQSFVESIALSNTHYLKDYYKGETSEAINQLFPSIPYKPSTNYKYIAFVGRGNNEGIVQEALRRRWWWGFSGGPAGDSEDSFDLSDNNLVWTQLMVDSYHKSIQSSNRGCSLKLQTCHYTMAEFHTQVSASYEPSVAERVRKVLGTNKGTAAFNYLKQISTLESLLPTLKVYLNLVGSSVNLDSCQLDVKVSADDQNNQQKTFLARKGNRPRTSSPPRIHNHIQGNSELGDKMNLFFNLSNLYQFVDIMLQTPVANESKYAFLERELKGRPLKYFTDPSKSSLPRLFEWIPLTFVVKGLMDPNMKAFQAVCERIQHRATNNSSGTQPRSSDPLQPIVQGPGTNEELPLPAGSRNIWILKPGENSNRGRGISVAKDIQSVQAFVKQSGKNPVIIQKYIENPLLYKGRKFDIRMYCLITWVYGSAKLYFYDEGYVRTSSFPFDLNTTDTFVHLTNEAVQIKGNDFGKFEKGNKVSLENLNTYIKTLSPDKDFYRDVLPKMKVTHC